MKMSMRARKVAGFAAGIVAGALLNRVRRTEVAAHVAAHVADETAAPAVQTEAPRQGETKGSSGKSNPDLVPERRRRKPEPDRVEGLTKQQLYDEARRRNIPGRSTMTKAQLQRALR